MSETYVTINYYRILRLAQILLFVLVAVFSVIQLAIDSVSLSQPINRIFEKYGTGATLTSSAIIPLMLSIASLAFIIMGAFALKKLSFRLTIAYAILTLIVFLTAFVTSIANLAIINNTIETILVNQYKSSFEIVPNVVSDFFQSNFKCCGLYGRQDWEGYLGRGDMVPYSCCVESGCNGLIASSIIWEDNCLTQMKLYLQQQVNTNAGFLLAYSFVMLASSVVSFVLSKLLRQEKYYRDTTALPQQ